MRVYVARHGETTWNAAGRYQGRLESELSALGLRQAELLAGAMRAAGVRRAISSPLRRCIETARPSAALAGVAVETDPRLIEIAHGTWEGRLRDEIAENDPERYRAWRHDPAHVQFQHGENLAQVLERWQDFARSLSADAHRDGARADERVLVVTHDAVVRVALLDTTGRSLDAFWNARVENGAYAELEVTAGRWTVLRERVNEHLGALRAQTEGQAL